MISKIVIIFFFFHILLLKFFTLLCPNIVADFLAETLRTHPVHVGPIKSHELLNVRKNHSERCLILLMVNYEIRF
jgi:hypothetical protein